MTGNNPPEAKTDAGRAGSELDRMPVKIAHLDTLLGLTGEIIIAASNISILQRHLNQSEEEVDKDTMEMVKLAAMSTNRISSDLHHLVMDIRMVPIKETSCVSAASSATSRKSAAGRSISRSSAKTRWWTRQSPSASTSRSRTRSGTPSTTAWKSPSTGSTRAKTPPATSSSPPTRRKASPTSR